MKIIAFIILLGWILTLSAVDTNDERNTMLDEAFKACTKACDKKEVEGCFGLGIIYEYGHGVKQDYNKAKEFYAQACEGKLTLGCKKYADLNKTGY